MSAAQFIDQALKRVSELVAGRKNRDLTLDIKSLQGSTASLFPANGPADERGVRAIVGIMAGVTATRSPKAVAVAIDCLQKLVASGVVQGAVTSLPALPDSLPAAKRGGPGAPSPQSVAVAAIVSCYNMGQEETELQVLKALLSLSGSHTLLLHSEALLAVVRVCFEIAVGTRSPTSQGTARAALVQLVTVAFRRMESNSPDVPLAPVSVRDPLAGVQAVLDKGPPEDASGNAQIFGWLINQELKVPPLALENLRAALAAAKDDDGAPAADDARPRLDRSLSVAPAMGAAAAAAAVAAAPGDRPLSPAREAEALGSASPPVTPPVSPPVSPPPAMADPAAAAEEEPSPAADDAEASGEEAAAEEGAAVGVEAKAEGEATATPVAAEVEGEQDGAEGAAAEGGDAEGEGAAEGETREGDDEEGGGEGAEDVDGSSPGQDAPGPADDAAADAEVVAPSSPSPASPAPLPERSATPATEVGDADGRPYPPASAPARSVFWRDAHMLFRALCRLSSRPVEPAGSSTLEAAAMRAKVLSLELVALVLDNARAALLGDEAFVEAIKQVLLLSLLKNCTSAVPEAVRLSCGIFLTLVLHFRRALKAEIGIFYPMVLLRVIEGAAGPAGVSQAQGASGTMSFNHLAVALRCLKLVCEDGQLLVDLFANYDCDLNGSNLFERSIKALVSLASGTTQSPGPATAGHLTPQQEAHVRVESLQCLVHVQESLLHWHADASGFLAAPASPKRREGSQDDAADDSAASDAAPSASASTSHLPDAANANGSTSTNPNPNGPTTAAANGAPPLAARRAAKETFVECVALFNKGKTKRAVATLQEAGLVGPAPADVAAFFKSTPSLDKTEVGNYMGELDDRCIAAMHAYVDSFDFAGLAFDAAIRELLAGFRLPGEAQKIDRIMEKFAERYTVCNPGTFPSADTAYVLAFSVIMLNTDAHNPMVKKKMTREAFIRNNRGISDGADLPEAFLSDIFTRITTDEIRMRGDAPPPLPPDAKGGKGKGAPAPAPAAADPFAALMLAKSGPTEAEDAEVDRFHAALREQARSSAFQDVTDPDAVRPMVAAVWEPQLEALAGTFKAHDAVAVVDLCLTGLRLMAMLACQTALPAVRVRVVVVVAQLTSLDDPPKIQAKSTAAIRVLLRIAEDNGSFLEEDSWSIILQCVSRLEALLQVVQGLPTDAALFGEGDAPTQKAQPQAARLARSRTAQPARGTPDRGGAGTPAGGAAGTGTSTGTPGSARRGWDHLDAVSQAQQNHPERRLVRAASNEVSSSGQSRALSPRPSVAVGGPLSVGNASFVVPDAKDLSAPTQMALQAMDPTEPDRLFVSTSNLNSEAIVNFVKALCAVAQSELASPRSPRVYSTAKIVEVAHHNMGRIRLVWTRIWAVLGEYFAWVGCHPRVNVALYAVDALRQLSMKFLERDELGNFSFQNDFLRPFVAVMRQADLVETREMVVRCMAQMVQARVGNIKSGWKPMFMVFTAAARDRQQQIVRMGFDTIERVVREHFDHITETEEAVFTDCVNCLLAFANNQYDTDVALNAIAFLRFCAVQLAEGTLSRRIAKARDPADPAASPVRPGAVRSRARAPDGAAPDRDRDASLLYWYPLLAGLSELAFDPQQVIRRSALEMLFDTLKFHGGAFAPDFWARVFESVVLPMFDEARTADDARADAWLHETCAQCLGYILDLVRQFYEDLAPQAPRVAALLLGLLDRPHEPLAMLGLERFLQMLEALGPRFTPQMWVGYVEDMCAAVEAGVPDIRGVIEGTAAPSEPPTPSTPSPRRGPAPAPDLRRLRLRASISRKAVKHMAELYAQQRASLPEEAIERLLAGLRRVADHARGCNRDRELRAALQRRQAEARLAADETLRDPPLLNLEVECLRQSTAVLADLHKGGAKHAPPAADVEGRLVAHLLNVLQDYARLGGVPVESRQRGAAETGAGADAAAGAAMVPGLGLGAAGGPPRGDSAAREAAAVGPSRMPPGVVPPEVEMTQRAGLAVETMRVLGGLEPKAFRKQTQALFPTLTSLVAVEVCPGDVRVALADLLDAQVGPMLAP